MKVLITGMAGFIGFHLTKELIKNNSDIEIVGLDNINDYYDVSLKHSRLNELGFVIDEIEWNKKIASKTDKRISFVRGNLQDSEVVMGLFSNENFDFVVNLAAQAGVRYSLINPQSYVDSNITGFVNILEGCRAFPVKHLIYASSSSVYGLNEKVPFSEKDVVDSPASLYAATKKTNEMMAHSYAHLFKVPSSGLRFFTVYGEWGRPDMASFLFVDKILAGKPIQLFNNGKMRRDFTYVGDIVKGISNLLTVIPQKTPNCEIYNIGNNSPVELQEYVEIIENALGKVAKKEYLPMQKGDVIQTYADVDKLSEATGFKPSTPLKEGIGRFVEWYKEYHAK